MVLADALVALAVLIASIVLVASAASVALIAEDIAAEDIAVEVIVVAADIVVVAVAVAAADNLRFIIKTLVALNEEFAPTMCRGFFLSESTYGTNYGT